MIYADQFIENNAIYLRNLNKNATSANWSTASGSYGFYSVPYEQPLAYQHYYYQKFTYKFTTTNQKPTWVQMYRQGGSAGGAGSGTVSAGLTPNQEYTYSAIVQPLLNDGYPLNGGTIYNGNSNAISGVSSQAKEVIMYDVTELYDILVANGLVTKNDINSLKVWCDNNLVYQNYGINYNVSSLFTQNTTKTFIKKGTIIENELIEADGMQAFSVSDTLRNNSYFDTGISVSVYNNKGNGTVTLTRVDAKAQNSPFAGIHPYVLKITTNGEAAPSAGGFHARHDAGANKIFVEKFVAKIPVGYRIYAAYNSQGTGSSVTILSDSAGTGNWEEYTILYKCGSTGSFSNGGHVYIDGPNNTSVTWYLAYVNNCDITGKEYLKNYTVMKNTNKINDAKIFTREFNECNIFPNGDFSDNSWTLPSGWSWDNEDYAGDSTRSLVQSVNAASLTIGPKIAIDPTARYKISYWVKSKQDMTSFLTAIKIFVGNTEVTHGNVMYIPGTKTQLTTALNNGDTVLHVKNAANWIVRNYSRIGCRTNGAVGWNNNGSQGNNLEGMVQSINTTNNTITLKVAWNQGTKAVNSYIVESYDGSTYPYPIQKSNLPTDNTWKYVEGYFGANNVVFGGSSSNGWAGLPCNATHMQLCINLYSNTSTVPIKYSDIKIEQVSPSAGHRYEQKIQIKEVN